MAKAYDPAYKLEVCKQVERVAVRQSLRLAVKQVSAKTPYTYG